MTTEGRGYSFRGQSAPNRDNLLGISEGNRDYLNNYFKMHNLGYWVFSVSLRHFTLIFVTPYLCERGYFYLALLCKPIGGLR